MYTLYASTHGSERLAKGGVQICRPQKLESLFEVARQVKAVTARFKRYSSTESFYYGNEPKWHELDVFVELHHTLLKDLGQRQRILNVGLLESALQRPKFMLFYEKVSLFRMAAGLGESIIKNHAFMDGNKRTGHLNGYDLVAEFWIVNNAKACK